MNITKIEKVDIELEWFKNKGLEIAKNICISYNSHCKEVSEVVVKRANELGIQCEVVSPLVFHKEDMNNNHYAIKYKDILIDYTLQQFLGNNTKVDFYTLWQSKPKVYTLNTKTLVGEVTLLPEVLSDIFDEKWSSVKEQYLIETI